MNFPFSKNRKEIVNERKWERVGVVSNYICSRGVMVNIFILSANEQKDNTKYE